jgi:polysaccharide biosynthesis protein PslG
VATRRRPFILGTVIVGLVALLAACDVPPPFESSVHSPGAESAKAPGVRSAADGTALADKSGVAGGSAILWASDADRNRQLDAIAATGARWFTLDIDWNSIQAGGPNSYWWDATDRLVIQARARGLKLIGILAYTPTWARGGDCPLNTNKCLPASAETYANMAGAAAQRYGTTSTSATFRNSITVWQVWNEPNHYPFVRPKVDVLTYTALLKATYVAVKLADFWTTVLAGGTAPAPDDPNGLDMSPVTFLSAIYYLGGKGYFDAFAHHPYSFPCNPLLEAPWNAFYQTAAIYFTMAVNGEPKKKVWGTESGAPTGADVGTCAPNSPGVSLSEPLQALWVHDYMWGWTVKYGAFTGPLVWHQIRDNGTNVMYPDDNFGLLRRNYSAKPSYAVFSKMMRGQ